MSAAVRPKCVSRRSQTIGRILEDRRLRDEPSSRRILKGPRSWMILCSYDATSACCDFTTTFISPPSRTLFRPPSCEGEPNQVDEGQGQTPPRNHVACVLYLFVNRRIVKEPRVPVKGPSRPPAGGSHRPSSRTYVPNSATVASSTRKAPAKSNEALNVRPGPSPFARSKGRGGR